MERISATDAARNFSDLLNRVHSQGVSFEITRGTEVVARIVPDSPPQGVKLVELDRLFAQLPKLDAEDLDQFAEDTDTIRQSP